MIKVEEATTHHAVDIARLTGALLSEIMEETKTKAFECNEEETIERIKDLMHKGIYSIFVAKSHEKVIGFVAIAKSYALYAQGEFGTITEFYVLPDYRSLGIGKMLIEKVKAFSIVQDWNGLEVTTPPLPFFQRSLLFYESNEFEIRGGRKLRWRGSGCCSC